MGTMTNGTARLAFGNAPGYVQHLANPSGALVHSEKPVDRSTSEEHRFKLFSGDNCHLPSSFQSGRVPC